MSIARECIHCDTLDRELVPVLWIGWTGDGARLYPSFRNDTQYKACEMFISRIFYFISLTTGNFKHEKRSLLQVCGGRDNHSSVVLILPLLTKDWRLSVYKEITFYLVRTFMMHHPVEKGRKKESSQGREGAESWPVVTNLLSTTPLANPRGQNPSQLTTSLLLSLSFFSFLSSFFLGFCLFGLLF